ncbi:hypothetical protein L1887_10611 [Cichorium endivia]|nr:hypothetical protein L1887_10611 [Cichorium endivia]
MNLYTPGVVRSYPVLASTWMTMRLLHVWLRYESLSVLYSIAERSCSAYIPKRKQRVGSNKSGKGEGL